MTAEDIASRLGGSDAMMTETATAFSRVLGRDVERVQVPWDVFEEQSGEEMTVMYRWFEDVGYDADIEALRESIRASSASSRFSASTAGTRRQTDKLLSSIIITPSPP